MKTVFRKARFTGRGTLAIVLQQLCTARRWWIWLMLAATSMVAQTAGAQDCSISGDAWDDVPRKWSPFWNGMARPDQLTLT